MSKKQVQMEEYKVTQDSSIFKDFTFGLVFGLFIGSFIGMFLAPKAGRELQQDITEQRDKVTQTINESIKMDQLKENIKEKTDEIKQKLHIKDEEETESQILPDAPSDKNRLTSVESKVSIDVSKYKK